MAYRKWGETTPTKTTSESVYEILYRNIINMNLVPGTILSEKEISHKMDVSRTPVRESFIKLSKESLIKVIPQKGSVVSKISLSRVKEERFLRESLETSVIKEIVLNQVPIPIDSLNKNLDEQNTALEKEDLIRFIELDDAFHGMLFNMADRPMCFDVILSFSSHYRRVRYLSMSVSGVSGSNLQHHKKLVQHLVKGDLEMAVETMKTHLRKLDIEKDIIFEKYSNYFEDESPETGLIGFDDTKLIK